MRYKMKYQDGNRKKDLIQSLNKTVVSYLSIENELALG